MKTPLVCAVFVLGRCGFPAAMIRRPLGRSLPSKWSRPRRSRSSPRVVLQLDVSAYRVQLDFDGDTLVMATPRGLHLVPPAGAATTVAQAFGNTFALAGSRVVYFREGKLWESKRGAPATALGPVALEPSAVVVNHEHLAWLERGTNGPSRILTFSAGRARQVAEIPGRWTPWRSSRVGSSSSNRDPKELGVWARRPWTAATRSSGVSQRSRPFHARDAGEPYYDGPTRSVRRISPDLGHEQVLQTGVICSPLAVRDRVVCAEVGGLYDLPLGGGALERLAAQTSFVTALATDGKRVAWISIAGRTDYP